MSKISTDRRDGAIVSTEWLSRNLGQDNLVIVDASWHIPVYQRDAVAEFAQGHIPGAIYLDIDVVADPDHALTHMLPDAGRFAETVGALGISRDSHVVVYDKAGLYSAARVWWMFHLYGHERVSVLDGGFPKWEAEGRPVETGPVTPEAIVYDLPEADMARVRNYQQMLMNVASKNERVIDVRTEDLYLGTRKNPYPGVQNGHIPNAVNLFVGELTGEDKTLLSPEAISAKFSQVRAGTGNQPVVFSCGSGVTACIAALAYYTQGHDDWAVYDGSWDEWGRTPGAPVDTDMVQP